MDRHPCPGFRGLAGRGFRHAATFRGRWPGLAAWQNGAFQVPTAGSLERRTVEAAVRASGSDRQPHAPSAALRARSVSQPCLPFRGASRFVARMTRRRAGGARPSGACGRDIPRFGVFRGCLRARFTRRRAGQAPRVSARQRSFHRPPRSAEGDRGQAAAARPPGAAVESASAAVPRGASGRSRSGFPPPGGDAFPVCRTGGRAGLPPEPGPEARGGLRARRACAVPTIFSGSRPTRRTPSIFSPALTGRKTPAATSRRNSTSFPVVRSRAPSASRPRAGSTTPASARSPASPATASPCARTGTGPGKNTWKPPMSSPRPCPHLP